MPIYEFKCTDCGSLHAYLLLRPERGVGPECRTCGSALVIRVISRVSVLQSEAARVERLAAASDLRDLDAGASRVRPWFRELATAAGANASHDVERMMQTVPDALAD